MFRIPHFTCLPDLPSLPGNKSGSAAPVLWAPADLAPDMWVDFTDPAVRTVAGSNITAISDKGTDGGAWSEGSAATQPTVNTADLNGFDTASFDADRLISPVKSLATGWSAFFVYQALTTDNSQSFLGAAATYIPIPESGSATTERVRIGGAADPTVAAYRRNGAVFVPATRGDLYTNCVTDKWMSLAISNLGPFGSLTLSAFYVDGNYVLRGKAAHLIIKSTTFTLDEVQRLEGWAAHRFGGDLLTDLDAGHPYKSSAPVV